MKVDVKIPTVGESVNEATIAEWLKKDGETVKRDDVLLNLETDKANVEVVAEQDGVLQIKAEAGATLAIGSVIGIIDTEGKAGAGAGASSPAAEAGKTTATSAHTPPSLPSSVPPSTAAPKGGAPGKASPILVPAVGESITEATVGSWLKPDGATVARDDVLLSLETDKASVEIVAEQAGTLSIQVKAGETVGIGSTLGTITPGGAVTAGNANTSPAAPAAAPQPQNVQNQSSTSQNTLNDLSPAVRHLVAEKNIDVSGIQGTGKNGRITKEDVMRASEHSAKPAAALQETKPTVARTESTVISASPVANVGAGERRERMSTIRKRIAERLVMAQQTAAILTTFNEVDLTEVMALRSKYKEKFKEKYDVGLGFMGFFTKAAVEALKEHPAVNAFIDGEDLVFHDYFNIGIAVGSPRGLVVPVVRNAQNLSIAGIEQEIRRLALKARDGKLTIDDMSGGTFTISNGGTYGSLLSTPILNPPQSGILGMHKIEERPVAVNGKVEIRPMMYLALSYDHRIIDGEGAVKFLVRIKEALEDPSRILLEI